MKDFPRPGEAVRGSSSGAPIMALFDLLGRRWGMGIIWNLNKHGPCTFRHLQELCENISPSVLNTRIGELKAAKLIVSSNKGYQTTEAGRELFGLLYPLGEWSKSWAELLSEPSQP